MSIGIYGARYVFDYRLVHRAQLQAILFIACIGRGGDVSDHEENC